MSFEAVQAYFESIGMADRVRHLEQSSATVELAARAVGTAPCQLMLCISPRLDYSMSFGNDAQGLI